MNEAADFLVLPATYWVSLTLCSALLLEAAIRFREGWAVPTMMIYGTILTWYFAEPLYTPATMQFSPQLLSSTYAAVFIFLAVFRLAVTLASSAMAPRVTRQFDGADLPAERIFWVGVVLWLMLLAFGTFRLNGDIIRALFPIDARAGVSMWQRYAGAEAGTFGFVVSTASYVYILILALFGMLLPLLKTWRLRVLCILCILISWPYAFLLGSRNVTLAVVMPSIFSFLFFAKVRIRTKLAVAVVAALLLEWALRQIIAYRDVGFDYQGEVASTRHFGLNMASELAYTISFLQDGIMQPALGTGFLAELANLVPRFLWPDKPLIGIDYAIARGFADTTRDTGVNTTISKGVIGQGVIEFGRILGPACMAVLMAAWSGWLARLWAQGTVPRACLFLVGMGLTFNLGRGITLLTLWPMVFAVLLVLVLERLSKGKEKAPSGHAGAGDMIRRARI